MAKARFKTAEGRFHLINERNAGAMGFHYMRATRLTLAVLHGGAEDGTYLIFNLGDTLIITRHRTNEIPVKSLRFDSSSKLSFPTSHSFCASSKDGSVGREGADLLVGCADGTVILMSLRAQLASSPLSTKPIVFSSLSPESPAGSNGSSTLAANHNGDGSHCTSVAWVPQTDGHFVAAYQTGNIFLYKKAALTGEPTSSKFSLSMAGKPSTTPSSVFTINGGGINDIALSPDGTRLAAACRDGALRVLDLATGTVVGGFQSYYGAMLCCAFSPDGKYIAAGGEDDLVAVYGMAERFPVLHCEGHSSWISRVAFDQWAPVGIQSESAVSDLAAAGKVYRLASGGQDTAMCLWDIQIPNEGDLPPASLASAPTMIRPASSASLSASLSANLAASDNSSQALLAMPTHTRKQSMSKAGSGICASLPRSQMFLCQPIMQHTLHLEPLSDLLFLRDTVMTADACGCIKTWSRPVSTAPTTMQHPFSELHGQKSRLH